MQRSFHTKLLLTGGILSLVTLLVKGQDTLPTTHGSGAQAKQRLVRPVFTTSGALSAGYEYGVIPFVVDTAYPVGFFKTEGNFSVQAYNIPVTVSYYYADIGTVTGLNNYFRVSFDERRFKQTLHDKAAAKRSLMQQELQVLHKEKQQAEQRLYYLRYLEANLPAPSAGVPPTQLQLPSAAAPATLSPSPQNPLDTLKTDAGTLAVNGDTLDSAISAYTGKVKMLQERIDRMSREINALNDPAHAMAQGYADAGRAQRFLYGIKKLELGLCYPSYSTFLVSGAPVRGVNMEYETSDLFFAFTQGTTISNLMFQPDPVKNRLQNFRNLYNFFDYSNMEAGRKITAVKLGYGKPSATHLHIGILYGQGNTSYQAVTDPAFVTNRLTEKNYAAELDGRYVINEQNTIDFVYGRSALQQEGMLYAEGERGFSSLLVPNHSNAALARFTSSIKKTATRITLTGRLVDPFFMSYGVGFLRPDNTRYEAKAEQQVSKKIKIAARYRREQDNLLSLYNINTTLQTIGTDVSMRISRHLFVRAGYNPVLQRVESNDNTIAFSNRNNISNVVLTWNPKSKRVQASINALYSYYNLDDGSGNNIYHNAGITNTVRFKSPFTNLVTINWFNAKATGVPGGNTVLATEELGYTGKKGYGFTAGAKLAMSEHTSLQAGYSAKTIIPVYGPFSLEACAEKLVIGDFYNTFDAERLKRFPYYTYIKLNCNW